MYLAFIIPKNISLASYYPLFMIVLVYNTIGLYLLRLDIISRNPSLSNSSISISDTSSGNIKSLVALSTILVNLILLGMYGLQLGNSLKGTNSPREPNVQGGGRRR
jgi:hypothetical protein